jgi:glycosyltransferase involved in cell wall biosynthesis
MRLLDLTFATRSDILTGIERYGLQVAQHWPNAEPMVALVTRNVQLPGVQTFNVPGPAMLGWLLAPFAALRLGARHCLFPTAPPSPLFFLLPGAKLIRVIHDVVPFTKARTMPLRGRLVFRDVEKLFLRAYRRVLCPTDVVTQELAEIFPYLQPTTCGNAPGIALFGPNSPVDLGGAPFLLAVGTLDPRKGYRRLLQAWHARKGDERKLVIVGRAGWGDVAQAVEEAQSQDPSVCWLANASDAELRWLYANCAAFVTLSQAEGFNMPLVEAGCFGAAVIASDIPIHRAVAADWATFVGEDVGKDALASALSRPTSARHGAASYRERFSWASVATRISEAMT